MYKIYINETPLYLTTIPESLEVAMPDDQNLVLRYAGKKKFLLNIIDQLEKSSRFENVVVCSKNIDKLWADFRDVYKIIEAAGGVVFNQNDETLLIYRRDYWDLPKGKIDKGESPLQAALREVEEETGLTKLLPGPPIAETWHTYKEKGHRMLKRTFWFRMDTDQTELELQHEEDIEKAQWITIRQFLSNPGKVYGNILDVLRKTLTIT